MTIISPTPPPTADETPPAPRHSVGVELVTAALRQYDRSLPADALAVVERYEGRVVKICATGSAGCDLERSARGYAHTYGATYVPAVTP
ncbi:hypothetical protein [Streptosporangium sp. NPDC002721]|uniref:hypothetical protein n=1 Tax=Streptosporangium sp. NPDC002721 TaxID=3366188 RepID=UPI0036A58882